ncbi:3-oxoadipate enol-lactonase 2 [Planctomycetes bacterium Pan216]|uniref:3-oxoadipate enol-lactonase 2 n=1 Tax=Kolteria novifilia TaxID=2527975 RepID=A0A518B7K1_9BACT|nr:3-oxoadipate enol-lactonase 2 [Planctomycetes bacterium Pan216]
MPKTHLASGLDIEYETLGRPEDPPLLLVMGLGAQLVSWPTGLCQRLAEAGRYVIRFDNRDCGLSTKFDDKPANLDQVIANVREGDVASARALAPYTLADMAGDAFELLDALGLPKAHVVGSSMGGAIAQLMAIERPERVLSLTSIMASTGEPEYGQATPEALGVLFAPSPPDREGYLHAATRSKVWRSKRYFDAEEVRRSAAERYDRSYYPQGTARQTAALVTAGPRAEALRRLSVPTLVVHGLDDTLVAPSGGERTAELVPAARLLLVEDMGHDRPEPLWPLLADAIIDHTSSP